MKTIGDRIKKIRLEKAWNQQDMAKKLHISTPAYSDIETNSAEIGISRLYEIASIFEVDIVFLVYSGNLGFHLDNMKELQELRLRIGQYDTDISGLQKKLISLYEKAGQNKRPGEIFSDNSQ
jgi:transcriptional regulator with XRE-family HTH domain